MKRVVAMIASATDEEALDAAAVAALCRLYPDEVPSYEALAQRRALASIGRRRCPSHVVDAFAIESLGEEGVA